MRVREGKTGLSNHRRLPVINSKKNRIDCKLGSEEGLFCFIVFYESLREKLKKSLRKSIYRETTTE